MRFSTSLRSVITTLVALPVLLATPALASTYPTAPRTENPKAHRAAAAKPAAPAAAPVAAPAPAAPGDVQAVCLTGIVLGTDGQPCPGACVFPLNNPRLMAVADAQGRFQLRVPAGTAVRLQADYFGIGSSRLTFDGQSAAPVRITLGQ